MEDKSTSKSRIFDHPYEGCASFPEEDILRIEIEDLNTSKLYLLDLQITKELTPQDIFNLTNGWGKSLQETLDLIQHCSSRSEGASLSFKTQSSCLQLFLTFKINKNQKERVSILTLQLQEQSEIQRLTRVNERLQQRLSLLDSSQPYLGEFSFNPNFCNKNIVLFHNNCNATKITSGQHSGVLSQQSYTIGTKVYWEFKIIRTQHDRGVIMIGVQETSQSLDCYPGHSSVPGISLYLNNGYQYYSNTNANYNIGNGRTGDTVGVLLDLVDPNKKTVTYSISGRVGVPIALSANSYWICANIHDESEQVKIIRSQCWRK